MELGPSSTERWDNYTRMRPDALDILKLILASVRELYIQFLKAMRPERANDEAYAQAISSFLNNWPYLVHNLSNVSSE